jgi:murein DD-endopeptidase
MRLPFNGNYPITQVFGVNPQDYAQFNMKGHNGIDYGLPSGTQVVAAEDGRVSCLEDPGGFGHYIEVLGPHKTIYAHLSAFKSVTGQIVKAGF